MNDAPTLGRAPYRLTIPADLAHVAKMRQWLGEVGRSVSLPDSRVFDLQVAASEAAANGIEHAASEVEIVAWTAPGRLIVEISNDGRFSPGIYKGHEGKRRGLGLPLMVSLADDVHVSRLRDNRTKVSLTFFIRSDGAGDSPPVDAGRPSQKTRRSTTAGGRAQATIPGRLVLALLLPVPLVIIAVAALHALNINSIHESSGILTAFNTLFVVAASLFVTYLAARTFLAAGSYAALQLGMGALALALGYLLAGPLLVGTHTGGLNALITVHSTLVLVAGGFFAAAGLGILRKGVWTDRAAESWQMSLSYCATVAFVVVWTLLAIFGVLPAFYTHAGGYTSLRTAVFAAAALAFLVAAGCFFLIYRRRPSYFALFIGASLAIFGTTLGSSLLTGAVSGSQIVWVVRAGQWISGIYLFAGALSAGAAGAWLLPLERTLRQSEARYTGLVDLNPDAVWIRSEGRFVFANAAAARLLGFSSPADLIGRDVDETFHPATRELQHERVARVYAGDVSPAAEETFVRADGSTVDVIIFRTRVEFGRRLGIQTVARDITEIKQAEEALRESEERYRALVTASSDAIYEMNPDWTEMRRPVGRDFIPDTERPNVSWMDLHLHPDDQTAVRVAIEKAIRNKSVFELEHRVLQVDGTQGWTLSRAVPILNATGEITHWFGTAKDITERKRAEEALHESEQRHRILAEENERLYRQQLDIAENLQFGLLNIPSEVGRLRVGHLYRSATEAARVGGDFYDLFDVKGSHVALLIGDVSGHGIEAARTATFVKDVVHAFAHQSVLPHQVLRSTNGLLVEKKLEGFVSLFLGIIDNETGTLRFASAGHPDTLLKRGSGEIRRLGVGSVPLGVCPDADWKPDMVQLDAGDLLLLYTDGVIEARRDGELFGQKRLEDLLTRKHLTVERLPRVILDQVLAYSTGTLRDDVAVLALLVTEAKRQSHAFSPGGC